MSRDWLLYLDDLIASAEKVLRFTQGRSLAQWQADEAAFDAVLFNLQVIGEAIKKLPEAAAGRLSEQHRRGPARLRDLIAHHYFALDAQIIWDVATRQVPALLAEARALRDQADSSAPDG